MRIAHFIAAAGLATAAFVSHAHGYKIGAIDIGHPHARATAPGQPTGAGYLKLTNGGAADKLLAASADVSGKVELHTMSMEGTVMRMRQVEAIDVPAGKTVALEPGGLHIMFVGLKAPLKVGESFPMKLRFEKAGEVTVEVKVEAAGDKAEHKHKH